MNRPSPLRGLILWAISFMLLMSIFQSLQKQVVDLSPKELKTAISEKKVRSLVFTPDTFEVRGEFISEKGKMPVYLKTRAIGNSDMSEIHKLAEANDVKCTAIGLPSPMLVMILSMLPWVLIIGVWLYMMKSQMRGMDNFVSRGGKRFQVAKDVRAAKSFKDVAGCEEAKEEVSDVVEFLKNPKGFSTLGGKVPRGVLMVGDPGTGKTLLAKAVAGEAGVPFLSAKGSEFVEMFVGVGAARVRALFEEARACAPCIVFIDEIDAIGKKRSVGIGRGHDEQEQTLNQLLTELDGFDSNPKPIIIIGATNRSDVLDEALIRPGRFDREVVVPRPDVSGRHEILKVHSRDKKLAENANLLELARDTAGMVGADLENVLNEAALASAKKKKPHIEQADLHEAVDKVSMGKARKSMRLSDLEKKMTAYHEGGHTLVAKLTPGADPVHKVTIIPRGQALGFTKQLPKEDRYSHTKKQLEVMIRVLAGGRVAEEMIFGADQVTTGASDDFKRATKLARRMVFEFGMSSAGFSVFEEQGDFWGRSSGTDASPNTKERMENQVEEILKKAVADVMKLLTENRAKLDALAAALLEKETLQSTDIDDAINSAA